MFRYILLYISALIVALLLFVKYNHNSIEKVKQREEELVSIEYNTVISNYEMHASLYYLNTVNQADVLSIFRDATSKDPLLKAEARKKLHAKLVSGYENMKLFQIRQLHFHLPDNESFLRFHRPEKYGDNLTGIRSTVEYVNREKKAISGFEEGRIFNGYRFVFPISYEGRHLGSVETSVSMKSVIDSIKKNLGGMVNFIIKRDVVERKVFDNEKSNYKVSCINDDYLYDKEVFRECPKAMTGAMLKTIPDINAHFAEKKTFSTIFYFEGSYHIRVFLPIFNPVTKERVAYLTTTRKSPAIGDLEQREDIGVVMIALILGIIVFFYKKSHDASQRLEKVFNFQNNIVILTDGNTLKFANRTFYNFFGYGSLGEYLKKYKCICDQFVDDEAFFSLAKVGPQDRNWLEAMQKLPERKRIVSMFSQYETLHDFAVSINILDRDNIIVTFADITENIKEKMSLKGRIMIDPLTQAYNRTYFDESAALLLEKNKIAGYRTACILFDIDFFKKVNDTYGHNVGDDVLRGVVRLVKANIRPEEKLIRWGGEEFIILSRVRSEEEAQMVAEKIRAEIEQHYFDIVGKVTCSFGIALYDPLRELKYLIEYADRALYEAKKSGRNRVVFYEK